MNPESKIRVAIMSYAMDNRRGRGTALYTRKLIENLLDDERIDLTLVHYETVDDPLYARARQIVMPALRRPFGTRFIRQLLFFWQYRHDHFDIIHWCQPRLYPLFWLAPASKVVATLHGAGDITAPGKKILSRRIFNFVLRSFNTHIDAAIAVSEHARTEIIKYYKFSSERVFVTYNGGGEYFKALDKEAAQTYISQKYKLKQNFLLDIARPEPQKNLDVLIRAYEILRKKYSRTEILVIAGSTAESYGPTFVLAKESPYKADIVFPGYIEEGDLNAFYTAASLFVFPSVDEGFGLPVIEAGASGTAVVTSNMSALREIAGDAALLADPHDPAAIADTINDVLSDKDLRNGLIEKGLAHAKQFTWKKTAEKTTELYMQLLNSASEGQGGLLWPDRDI